MSTRPPRLRALLLPFLAATTGGLLACTPPNVDPDAGSKGDAGSEDDAGTPDCTMESWDIEEDTTLSAACSPYEIDADVNVENDATLTIEAGTELRFTSGHWLRVGNNSAGKLVAEGTADDPIVFTSSDTGAGAGAWLGVMFSTQSLSGNVLRHVVVQNAGEELYGSKGCVTLDRTPAGRVTIEDARFEACDQAAVAAINEGSELASFARNTFVDSPVGLYLHPSVVGSIAGSQTYEETPINQLEGGNVSETATWALQGVPWRALSSVTVEGDDSPVLTLAAGTVLRFPEGEWLQIGANAPGGLVAVGTDDANVVFESTDPNASAGAWLGVVFRGNTLNGSRIEKAILRDGGEASFGVRGCLHVDDASANRITVKDTLFERCAQSGASVISEDSAFTEFSNNTFTDCDAGLWVNATAVASIAGNQTYQGTTENRMDGTDIRTTQAWAAQDVPWIVLHSLGVHGDASPVLTIEGGSTLRFPEGEWFQVGANGPGGLVLAGTESAPVILESSQPSPAAGAWLGLNFGASTMNGTLLEHAILRHAGQEAFGQDGTVDLNDTETAITIRDTTFEDSLQSDVFIDCGSNPLLERNTMAAGVVYETGC